MPSLQAYLVFAQTERKAWVWVRGRDGFPSEPEIMTGQDAVITDRELSIDLPLSEVYKGVRPG